MVLKKLLKKKRDTRYLFFSGKGGVGKTSIAAATALWLARSGKKVLIISTDPAHSLSDSFGVRIGGEVKKLEKNLSGVEIDPKMAVEEYKEKLTPQLEKIEYLKGMGLDGMFDLADSTPGIDEMAAFDKFLQYMHSKEYDVIVFDTAPTGHALRFLSLPDLLDSWVGKLIKFRMRFAGIANLFKKILPFGNPEEKPRFDTEQLEAMKARIEEARKILSDPEKTHYNIVLIPEQMAILESERCIKALQGFGIPVRTVIVNQLIPNNPKCSFCTSKRREQQKRLESIKKKFGNFQIIQIPMYRKEVRGTGMLEVLGKTLYERI